MSLALYHSNASRINPKGYGENWERIFNETNIRKTKQEIRLYFHIHPKAKLDEVAKLFEKKSEEKLTEQQ